MLKIHLTTEVMFCRMNSIMFSLGPGCPSLILPDNAQESDISRHLNFITSNNIVECFSSLKQFSAELILF